MFPGIIWIIPALISTTDDIGFCVYNIAERYFTEHYPLYISWEYYVNSLLYKLHDAALWTVKLTFPEKEQSTFEFSNEDKQYNYMVFTSGKENLIDQMEELKMRPNWNPRGKFIVVGSHLNVQDVAQELWTNYNVVNVLILNSDFERMYLFSLEPYQCSKVDLLLIDSWHVTEKSSTHNSSSLSTRKTQTDYQGCPLRSGAMHCPTFVKPLNGFDYWGVEADLFKFVARRLNMTVIYEPFAYSDSYEGASKVLEALSVGAIDVAFGCLPWHPVMNELADTTTTHLQDTLKWMVPCGKPLSRTTKIGQTFSPPLWTTMFFVFVSVVITLYLYAVNSSDESRVYRSFSNCFYFVWAVTIGISVPIQPKTSKIRLVFIILVWYCFVMSMVFQTYFVSNLVHPGFGNQVGSLEELYREGYTLYVQSGTADFFDEALGNNYDEIKLPIQQCPFRACLDEYLNLPKVVTITCRIFIEYQLLERLPLGKNAPKLCMMEEDMYVIFYGFHLQKGSPLLGSFNLMVRRTLESGVYEKIKSDLKDVFRYTQLNESEMLNVPLEDIEEYFVFSMVHLAIAFYVLVFGSLLSFVLFLFENVANLVHKTNTSGV
ncbi:Ionotropic receptor 260 [Blattella germanica]|nr:Ionotropic receptor 260 [Blattella germanica]